MPAPDRNAGLSVRGSAIPDNAVAGVSARPLITALRGRRTVLPRPIQALQPWRLGEAAAAVRGHDEHHRPGLHRLRSPCATLIRCDWQWLPTGPLRGLAREHTESDLRSFLIWSAERGLDPLAARDPHLELCIRRMQEIRWFKRSAVSRPRAWDNKPAAAATGPQ